MALATPSRRSRAPRRRRRGRAAAAAWCSMSASSRLSCAAHALDVVGDEHLVGEPVEPARAGRRARGARGRRGPTARPRAGGAARDQPVADRDQRRRTVQRQASTLSWTCSGRRRSWKESVVAAMEASRVLAPTAGVCASTVTPSRAGARPGTVPVSPVGRRCRLNRPVTETARDTVVPPGARARHPVGGPQPGDAGRSSSWSRPWSGC